MVNVLYLHNSSMISGGERSLLQLWAQLDRRAFTPYLVVPSEGPLVLAAQRLGVEVEVLTAPAIRPWTVFRIVAAARRLMVLVREKHVGVIHSYAPRNNLLAACVGRAAGVPVIWHERNLVWGREIDVTRLMLGFADAVICNSRAVARRFSRTTACLKKVRVILNGVDTVHFAPPQDKAAAKRCFGWEGRKVVGFVGNLEPRKGVDVFFDVAAHVARVRRDIVFVVVGGAYRGQDRTEVLRRKAAEAGLGACLVWAGFQEDVRPYLGAFDVSCNVTEKEACSRAILESMAMAVPVVAFDDGGNPELVEDGQTGLLVPATDVRTFAASLLMLLDNAGELQKMGQQARVRAEALFDIKKNTQETQALYRELV